MKIHPTYDLPRLGDLRDDLPVLCWVCKATGRVVKRHVSERDWKRSADHVKPCGLCGGEGLLERHKAVELIKAARARERRTA